MNAQVTSTLANVTARRSVGAFGKAALSFNQAVASLDYSISKEPIYDADHKELAPEFRGMFNSKTRKAIGVVGSGFTYYQPAESLEIMRAAVDTVSGAKWKSVVVTHGGAHISAFAQIKAEIKAPQRGDRVGLSFFMRDSFNGTGRNVWGVSGETLACTNGMVTTDCIFAIGGKHTPSLKDRIEAVRFEIGMRIQDEVEKLRGFVYRLDSTPMSKDEMDTFTLRLFDVKDEAALADTSAQLRSKVDSVRTLFARGTGNVGQTRWDAFNAVTEFADWQTSFRTTENTSAEENRFLSILGGPVMKLKDRARELLLS